MMKINSKQTVVLVLSLSMLQVVVVTPIAFAANDVNGSLLQGQNARMEAQKVRMDERQENMAERQGDMEERKMQRQAASCERISSMGSDHFQKFDDKKSRFGQNFGEKMTAFEDRRDSTDATLNDAREKQDERRNEMYMRLEDTAKTDSQKAAVEAFKKTVEVAVIARRQVVNDATDAFRKDVDALVTSKKSSVSGAVDTFQTSVKAAFEKAQASCVSGTDPQTVREILTTSLKDAREKLQASRQSFEGVGDTIPALAATKKTAIDKAMQDFKTTMENARIDLKDAFQQQ